MKLHVLGVYKLRARLLSPVVQTAAGGLDPEKTRPGNDLPYESHHTSFDKKIILVTAAFLFLLIAVLASHALLRRLLRRFARPSTTPLPASDAPSKPMKKSHVNALPTSTFALLSHSDMAAQCPICLTDFHEGDLLRVMPTCHHGFHVGCVDRWLYKQATCPTCRADLLKCEQAPQRSRSVEVHIVITARGELCPSLSKSPT